MLGYGFLQAEEKSVLIRASCQAVFGLSYAQFTLGCSFSTF